MNKTETLYGGICAHQDDDDDDNQEEVMCTCSDKINECSTNKHVFSCIGIGALAKGKSEIHSNNSYIFCDSYHVYEFSKRIVALLILILLILTLLTNCCFELRFFGTKSVICL